MLHPDIAQLVLREHLREIREAVRHEHLAALVKEPRTRWYRRGAAPIGRAMVHVGSMLVRYAEPRRSPPIQAEKLCA